MTATPPDAQVEVFPALDTMRAIAASGVVVTHVAFQAGLYSDALVGTALARLDLGVALFFVLSGFLLSRPFLLRSRLALPAPSIKRYLSRRALRVIPVYVVVVVAAILFLEGNDGVSWQGWLRNLTLTDVYAQEELPAGLTQMWSLSAEVAFYLLLPLALLAGRPDQCGRWRVRRLFALLAAATVLNVVWVVSTTQTTLGLSLGQLSWLPAYLTWFGVGILLAVAQVHASLTPVLAGPARALRGMGMVPGTCLAAAGALFLIACTPLAGPTLLAPPTTYEAVTKNLLYAAIAGLVVLPGIFAPADSGFARVMSWGPLRHLGHISYSIFCCHLIVLALVAEWREIRLFTGDGTELLVLTLLCTYLVSEVLYRLVERPFMRLSRRPTPVDPTTKLSTSDSVSATHS